MENIKTKVDIIKNNIKSLTEELLELQTQCTHKNISLKYYEDTKTVLKVCVECQKIIGYPTNEELRENDYM